MVGATTVFGPRFWMKSVGVPVDPEGNAAGETAVERIADEVGHAAGATRCREDDDRILVRRHLSLRQGRVVERDDVAECPVFGLVTTW